MEIEIECSKKSPYKEGGQISSIRGEVTVTQGCESEQWSHNPKECQQPPKAREIKELRLLQSLQRHMALPAP